ncbi:MAG: hypothetical protein A2177_09105 [Spirochaetes bacterium RBG_13_68_11]|nr:MAG: hypothetical protein A2177_09105 [Spirochaetes bacterium RBG_13_68_11]
MFQLFVADDFSCNVLYFALRFSNASSDLILVHDLPLHPSFTMERIHLNADAICTVPHGAIPAGTSLAPSRPTAGRRPLQVAKGGHALHADREK